MTDPHSSHRFIAIVPNVLSGLRLGLALTFPLIDPRWWVAAIVAAGVSDFVDGVVARRFGVTSWIGGLLDAVADKAMTLAVLLTLTVAGVLEWWQVALLLSRDVTVGVIAGYAVYLREWGAFKMMPSRMLGKLTTAAIIVALLLTLLTPGRPWHADRVVYAIAVVLSAAAAIDYLRQFQVAHAGWKKGLRPEA